MRHWQWLRLRSVLIILPIFLVACATTTSQPSLVENQIPVSKGDEDLCDQSPDFGFFQLESAGRVATLGEAFQIGTLGQQGALDLASELVNLTNSYCTLEIPLAMIEALEEIDRLYESGQDTLAEAKLDELLADIERDTFFTQSRSKIALLQIQQGGPRARRAVRAYLTIAARAQIWGNDDRADQAIASASEVYEAWASGAIENADMSEALTIAAEAQLLGLDELGDEAIARATDLAEAALAQALEAFEPCLASQQEARNLLRTVATAMLLGIDADAYGFNNEFEEWLDINQRRQRGEAVPECETWQVNLKLETVWDSGSHAISWEGFFIVLEDGALDGQGTGSLASHTEITCVNVLSGEQFTSTTDVTGTFSFEIQGRQDVKGNTNLFKFQFPAVVTVSGVDTCNPFDETTFLPKYVIEEIHSSGGVDGYDMTTDQIFLVVPATDGATEVYETVIGPVTLTLKKRASTE